MRHLELVYTKALYADIANTSSVSIEHGRKSVGNRRLFYANALAVWRIYKYDGTKYENK